MPKNVNPKDVAVSTESLKRYQRISHIVEAIDTKKVQLQTLERETKGREKQRFGRKLRTLWSVLKHIYMGITY